MYRKFLATIQNGGDSVWFTEIGFDNIRTDYSDHSLQSNWHGRCFESNRS